MPTRKDTNSILIKNANVHNLKNLTVSIPRNKLVVITGLSGSGKSSLAFDTLYAEGQRRYVESLSSYARQFLGRINKPDVEYIRGIPPAIAIEQKVKSNNPRSTVGTSTEIYDYMKLLFSKIGKTYSPVSGDIVKKYSISDILKEIYNQKKSTSFFIIFPINLKKQNNSARIIEIIKQQGFSRIFIDNQIKNIDEIELKTLISIKKLFIVVDRIALNDDDDTKSRIADSLQIAFAEGKGECLICFSNGRELTFSNKFEADGISFHEPDVNMFSFNNPMGACEKCEGFGTVMGIDPELVVPDKSLSVYQDAITCWKGEKMQDWKDELIKNAEKFNFPVHRPYNNLSYEEKEILWKGNKFFSGIKNFFSYIESKAYKIQYRVLLARYRGKTQCSDCEGSRLKKESTYVKINNYCISDLINLPLNKLISFFSEMNLSDYDRVVAQRIISEIKSRLEILCDLGLGYLSLNRSSSTLSGGEFQRINLANSLGSSLVGSLYILDEPSIGLHQRDTKLLIITLKKLRDLGNSVIVVEHDEEIIKASDEIIDIGPFSGRFGGEVVFQGHFSEFDKNSKSLTK
ncbi:MAG: excinuclease ABC subunit A, partial [Bacteroidota bacterium]